MNTYYNEFDKDKCLMLSQLMKDGHISKGEIDDRPIQQVAADDVKSYTRCHFFAGIGLWDYALNLADWEEDRVVWTGSCPCQPFSAAGRQKGKADDRHLWPEWQRLISECSPATIFGEQVNAAITQGWLDDVYQGLEAQDYAVGSVVLPASAIGAPHRRERLWFVADSRCQPERGEKPRLSRERKHCEKEGFRTETRHGLADGSAMGNSEHNGYTPSTLTGGKGTTVQHNEEGQDSASQLEGAGSPRELPAEPMGNSTSQQSACNIASTGKAEQGQLGRKRIDDGFWENGEWINCPDGKQRLIEPSIPLLVNGDTERVGLIHAAGDAIVPQVAAEFIKAFMDF